MPIRKQNPPPVEPIRPKRKEKLSVSITHDEFVRFIFSIRRFVIAFLKAFLNPETIAELDLDHLTMDDCLYEDDRSYRRYTADVSLTIPLLNGKGKSNVSIQLEHKSYSSNDYIVQLETYASLRHRKEYKIAKEEAARIRKEAKRNPSAATPDEEAEKHPLSRIIPFLLYNGPDSNPGVKALEELYAPLKGVMETSINFKPIIVNLRTINIEDLPSDPDCPELQIGLLALKLVFGRSPLDSLESLLEKVTEQAQKFGTTEEALLFGQNMVRYYAAHTAKDQQDNLEKVHVEFTKRTGGKRMDRGAALVWYNKLIERGRAEGIAEGIAEGEARGIAEGEARGFSEGEARGEINNSVKNIVVLLNRKFAKVPKTVENRLRKIRDLTVLESLLISAMESKTLEEFKNCL